MSIINIQKDCKRECKYYATIFINIVTFQRNNLYFEWNYIFLALESHHQSKLVSTLIYISKNCISFDAKYFFKSKERKKYSEWAFINRWSMHFCIGTRYKRRLFSANHYYVWNFIGDALDMSGILRYLNQYIIDGILFDIWKTLWQLF